MSIPAQNTRREAREKAVQILYQLDTASRFERYEELIALFFSEFTDDIDPKVRQFAEQLCRGVAQRLSEIDRLIELASKNWRLERMSRVDRNILRLAVFEMSEPEQLPAPVIINEAIELGKAFGTAESGSFINGILGQVQQELKH